MLPTALSMEWSGQHGQGTRGSKVGQVNTPINPTQMGGLVKVVSDCCDPMDCSPPGSSILGILQARILEWTCHLLLQGIFLTQGWSLGHPHCRQILYQLSHQGSPTRTASQTRSKPRLIPSGPQLLTSCFGISRLALAACASKPPRNAPGLPEQRPEAIPPSESELEAPHTRPVGTPGLRRTRPEGW